jgi:hypothetical protein
VNFVFENIAPDLHRHAYLQNVYIIEAHQTANKSENEIEHDLMMTLGFVKTFCNSPVTDD